MLTQRLEGLEAAGVLVRMRLPPPVSAQVYELTQWGYEAEPLFQALGRWAARSPTHDPSLPLSAASLMLSFRTMLDPDRADGFKARIAFEVDGEPFAARIRKGRIDIQRGATDEPDVTLSGPARMIAAAVYGGQPLEQLVADGVLKVTGDLAAAERFVRLFPLPAKAAAPPRRVAPTPLS